MIKLHAKGKKSPSGLGLNAHLCRCLALLLGNLEAEVRRKALALEFTRTNPERLIQSLIKFVPIVFRQN